MALMKKTSHIVVAILVIAAGIYVYHMVANHQGQSMVPHFGSK